MTKKNIFYVLGSGWISSSGYGFFGSKPRFSNENKDLLDPDLQNYIDRLPSRIGRFDAYTKACFSAAVLALHDADLIGRNNEDAGIIAGSRTGVYDNDIAFFESTREENGSFSSPNLFSYTLPNVALGEIAVFFNFTGPSFCVGNDSPTPGNDALRASVSLLGSGQCAKILTGWAETSVRINAGEEFVKGAMFALISKGRSKSAKKEFVMDGKTNFKDLFEK